MLEEEIIILVEEKKDLERQLAERDSYIGLLCICFAFMACFVIAVVWAQ